MFCSKCGAKNKDEAKFCEKCGNKLDAKSSKVAKEEIKPKAKDKPSNSTVNIKNKIANIPKKAKIGIGIGLIVVVAVIALAILLSNPVKKVEDYLTSYYNNYTEEYSNRELVSIGDILRANKNDEKTLDSISKQIKNTISNWVKNFNKAYKDTEDLESAYQKIKGVLESIYTYFDGLEYVLTYDEYYLYREELYDLYYSKYNYFKALEASSEASKYSYYSLVIESDYYYKEASEFISEYLSEELASLKTQAQEIVNIEDATNKEWLEAYIKQIEFLEENKYYNNIDLSSTEEYQELYNEAASKIVEYTTLYAKELENNYEINEVIDMIEDAMESLEYESTWYNELQDLKSSYEDKTPSKLIEAYEVSRTSGISVSAYGITLDGEDYDSYIRMQLGDNEKIVYRLNNQYTIFKTALIRSSNWDTDIAGEIVIYGDGIELYRGDLTNEFASEISIDVTGVIDLSIELITASKPDNGASIYIYLVEPYLYK